MDIFTAFGLSFSAGLNAYIPLLILSLLAKFTDLIKLDPPWDTLTNWWVIGALVFLSLIEFFADKIPAVNHINDAVQTIIRPAAGAIVFAATASVADIHPVLAMVAGLLVAGGVHATKSAAVRPAVTATTGGAGNVPVSIFEDIVSTVVSFFSIIIPIIVAVVVAILILLVVWWLWRRANREIGDG
ncbi:MAG: DUF4126 domain-containing protein [Anaerolineales bacterium]